MEKIVRIEEIDGSYDGFKIHTDSQIIEIGIDNGQSCCEEWGCIVSEDDLTSFIGSIINEIKITDTALNTKTFIEEDCETQIMFVTIETSNGPLQFAFYNSHNGYYGHTAFVKSTQLNYEECL